MMMFDDVDVDAWLLNLSLLLSSPSVLLLLFWLVVGVVWSGIVEVEPVQVQLTDTHTRTHRLLLFLLGRAVLIINHLVSGFVGEKVYAVAAVTTVFASLASFSLFCAGPLAVT